MKNLEACQKEAEKAYQRIISSGKESSSFPLRIPLGKPNPEKMLRDRNSHTEGIENIEGNDWWAWKELEEAILGIEGISIESKTQKTRKFGEQTLPRFLVFGDWDSILLFLGKRKEYDEFIKLESKIREAIPELEPWTRTHWKDVLVFKKSWDSLLEVVIYFLERKMEKKELDLYLRELPVPVHTKFIEQNTGILKKLLDFILESEMKNPEESDFSGRYFLKSPQATVRFRILDTRLQKEDFLGWSDISILVDEFSNSFPHHKLEMVFIIENLASFLSFPSQNSAIAIFGKGFHVGHLKNAHWLKEKKIYYWGDIDVQGFQILSMIRKAFPDVHSIFMDEVTWNEHSDCTVEGTPSGFRDSDTLREEEKILLKSLILHPSEETTVNPKIFYRLEQEKISLRFIQKNLPKYLV